VTGASITLAVVGAHLRGQPLNHQLVDRSARFVGATTTADCYRLFALRTDPPKPGLVRVHGGDVSGRPIDVEVWELGVEAFGSFVAEVPGPLAIGRVRLADGSETPGFVCESIALEDAVEITAFGGWRAYLADLGGPG